MIRLYINSFDAERLWSTDSGPGTEEFQWDEVEIVGPPSITQKDLSKRGSKIEPCCWIEVSCAKITQRPDGDKRKCAVIEWS